MTPVETSWTTTAPLVVVGALLVGCLLGGAMTWWTMRLRAERDLAAAETERDLLRDRVGDLEHALDADDRTAALLAPLGETVARVERQVGALERDRVSQYADLAATIRGVQTTTGELGRATHSLAGSLHSANVRGAWGEVQLRRVLEHAGMLERVDFDTQVRAVGSNGRGVRPDAVVRLPGDKILVVDAKAPMRAFLQAQGDEVAAEDRTRLHAEHAAALTGHVQALCAKEYWSAFETTPEMVVCFVPTEAMLSAALAADPSLHETAMRSRVVLVGPGSLFALLRTVAFTWQQDALSANARELLTLGRELHTRLATLGGHVGAMGASLSRSIESYNRLVGALEARVLVTARRFHDLELVEDRIEAPVPIETGPRPLTALELLDEVSAPDRRPELLVDGTVSDRPDSDDADRGLASG
ncbi:DNA recombination protein RmuC [Nostocoides sp. F2B08]|uniref:DNA recombination protein RmuC n=1 Tax=Nostocoides sp. F2B08 TaxID=2653936 RepID=UPI001D042211|nr:DNA recombination protein RmuC [Tetrasphaera sp. F2B08]